MKTANARSGARVHSRDWADRLTKVTSNGIVVLENWYDVAGRRIAKRELAAGQRQFTFYVSDGWDIVGSGDQTQALETFTRGTGLAGDIGTLIAVSHQTGGL